MTVFTKNRERPLSGAVAQEFFAAVVDRADREGLLSREHVSVDGTLDVRSFFAQLRTLRVTPHVAQNQSRFVFTAAVYNLVRMRTVRMEAA